MDLFSRVLPIFFLIFIGYAVKKFKVFKEDFIETVKKLVVKIALPAVLFITFLNLDLNINLIFISSAIIFVNLVLFYFGKLLRKKYYKNKKYFPFMMSGFVYGLLGWSLFSTAYGIKNISSIASVDFGNEIFVWFIFIPFILKENDTKKTVNEESILKTYFKSPVLIALFAGLLMNIFNLEEFFYRWWLGRSFEITLKYLSSITVPMILIVIGFGLELKPSFFKDLLALLFWRLIILLPSFFLINFFIINVLKLPLIYQHALFTLLILPPPFSIPVFMSSQKEEISYVNIMLTGYTFFSVIIFSIYFIFVS